jgi:hypothetical protein
MSGFTRNSLLRVGSSVNGLNISFKCTGRDILVWHCFRNKHVFDLNEIEVLLGLQSLRVRKAMDDWRDGG